MRNYFVYEHISPDGKRYIGITYREPVQRWGNGGYGYHKNAHFYRAITKYGWDSFAHNVLASGISKEDAEQMEIALIAKYKSNEHTRGYNIEGGGNAQHTVSDETRMKISDAHRGRKGRRCSDETRLKIRLSHLGKGPSPETAAKIAAKNRGRHPTDEQRMRMSTAHVGRVFSAERNRKISIAHTGRVFSAESRNKLSASQKNRLSKTAKPKPVKSSNRSPLSDETKQKIREAHNRLTKDVECFTFGGEIIGRYASLVEAEEKTGIKKPNIWCACNGKSKSAGGFRWRYA